MNTYSQINGKERRFSFICDNVARDAFEVVRFEGEEALAALYRFELLLVSRNSDISERELVGKPARFTLNDGSEGGKETIYRGLVQELSYQYQTGGWTCYRAVLVPKFWRSETYYLSEVYLDKSRPEIFKVILENSGLTGNDYDLRLREEVSNYPKQDYVCQYKESYFNFIARWADRLGIYWWYEDTGANEKVVFSDTRMAHKDQALVLQYQPPGEQGSEPGRKRRINTLTLESRSLPRQVVVMDYNEQRASHEIQGKAAVDPEGTGAVYLFGNNLKTNAEAEQLAKLRAEGIRSRGDIYQGSSTATGLRCGEFMEVQGHPRQGFNRRYLLTAVRHQGSQAGLLTDGLRLPAEGEISHSADFYLAEISAISADVQFRPEIKHVWPKIEGTLIGFVDAEGSGEYAELNEKGEYKIQVPFDITHKGAQRSSAWIRKSSQYAGSDYGMHLPLLKGAEVLLSFINGDPDQPVITGAMPNSISPNVVTNDNQRQSRILTAGGNEIILHDQAGNQYILMNTPLGNASLRMGAVAGAVAGSSAPGNIWINTDNGNFGVTTGSGLASPPVSPAAPTDGISLTAYSDDITLTSSQGDIILNAPNGNITQNIKGNSTENVNGSITSWIAEDKTTYTYGDTTSYFAGAENSVTIGAKNSLYVGLCDNLYVGGYINFYTFKFDMSIMKWEWVKGAHLEAKGFKGQQITAYFKSLGTEVKATGAAVKKETVAVEQKGVEVEKKDVALAQNEVVLEQKEVNVDDTTTEVRQRSVSMVETSTKLDSGAVEVRNRSVSLDSGTKILTP
ncbi:type VI secretion system tip protein TssI/VgrG [Candidatus Methylospira mobilis]|uniref:type VI secretion system tip protein TssI/VgrG n=1 Tax=Candidatus Methylospira mobilis TaxID=1808979 RepID=UPI0028ED8F44|nr:type VI secretion system tip protein TssI/VgrG [Candidatus Methylospira mobilis]WNV03627.1 type VI secretion system tip protein TssI/VgrG [Candidatus Methylospira mobilis]